MERLNAREAVAFAIESGKSQSEIARLTDVSQATISRILNGEHEDPKGSLLDKLRDLVDKIKTSESRHPSTDSSSNPISVMP